MPARFPVVTEVQASSVPGAVSCTFRSGLRKFTGAKRVKRLPASLSFPCHTVSRPRYSAPYQVTRTRRPRSAAVKGRAVLHDVQAVQHIQPLDRRGADDLNGKPHRHRAGPDDVAHECFAHGQFLPTHEPRVFRKRGDGRGERTVEIEEKPVFIAGYSGHLWEKAPHHGVLCCLDDTTDPRGTKPSVVRYWANLVTGYSATARWCGLAAATRVTA